MNKSHLNISQIFNYCHQQQPFLEGLYTPLAQEIYTKELFVQHWKKGYLMNESVTLQQLSEQSINSTVYNLVWLMYLALCLYITSMTISFQDYYIIHQI